MSDINEQTIDWRTLNVEASIDEAVLLIAMLAKQHNGHFKIEYDEHRDCGDYPCDHDDKYEVTIWAKDFQYSGEGRDDKVSTAIMQAVIALLQDIDNQLLLYEKTLNAARHIDDATLRDCVEKYIEYQLSPDWNSHRRFDLLEEIRRL